MPTFTDILPILAHYLHLGDLIKVVSTSLECSDLVHYHIEERRAEISTNCMSSGLGFFQCRLTVSNVLVGIQSTPL